MSSTKVLASMLAITLNRSFGALTDAIPRNLMVFVCDKLGIVRQYSCLGHPETAASPEAVHLPERKLLDCDVRSLEGIDYSLHASDGEV